MSGGAKHKAPAQGAALLAMLLALLVNVLTPPGFMPGEKPGEPLVVCTGHGPMRMDKVADERRDLPTPAHHHGQICAFADHGLAPSPPQTLGSISQPLPGERVADQAIRWMIPGIGLAAPPPPSHAPPLLLL